MKETGDVPLGTLTGGLDEESRERIRRKLVGVQMLACVQNNLMDDIQAILREKKKLKFEVKRNMGEIKRLVMRNMGNNSFLGRLSQEALDVYFEDYEELESWIYRFIEK